MNLEALLCHEQGFQLVEATPLQRAICRMETGEPLEELAERDDVREAIGGVHALHDLPACAPSTSCLMAAVRTAKSQKAAAKAFRASQTCDLGKLKDGEIARYSVLSIDKDKAQAVYEHLVGKIKASPLLSQVLLKEPAGESVFLMHPSGRPVEIKVMAGKRAGGSLVARWSIGATFDEAPRMNGSDMKVNLPDALVALKARLLPGAQIDLIGSPWAPAGLIYDLFVDRFGRPGDDLVFMIAKGPDMNPSHFTPELCAKLLKEDPMAHRTDVLALFADPPSSLLSSIDVELCSRKAPVDLEPNNQEHVAAIDPANRKNAWTLTIVRPKPNGDPEVALTRQWIGSHAAPLMSSRVFEQIRPLLELYGIEDNALYTDQANFDDKWELATDKGIQLIADPFSEAEWRGHAKHLEKLVSEHRLELPPNAAMRADILGIQKRLTARSWHIILPNTGDGRHGDYVPSLCLALKHLPAPRAVEETSTMDDAEKRICDFINSSKSRPMQHAAQRLAGTFG
ncbi:MAG TPA: hypothetical protein VJN18_35810 [Polyangiaceae bacterium]|nr:hypothetical protein [Polyangiaceae bacterium]